MGAPQNWVIANNGPLGTTVAYVVVVWYAQGSGWLSLNKTSGTIASGATDTVQVSTSTTGLTSGQSYNATLMAIAPGSTGSPLILAVMETVSAVTATHLSFSTQPAGARAGAAFTTQPVLQALKADNSVDTSYTTNVTLAITPATGTGGATLIGGSVTIPMVAGVATYSGVGIDLAGTGYTLTATSGSLTSAISSSFTVAGVATHLAFSQQPGNAVQGAALATQPKVQALLAGGGVDTEYTANATIAISAGGTLTGTVTLACVAGEADFSGVGVTGGTPVAAYTLAATSGALTGATSSSFSVTSAHTLLAGDSTIETGIADPWPSGWIGYYKYVAAATGNAVVFQMYLDPAHGTPPSSGMVAIYADSSGAPGALLNSATVSSPTTGWNAITIASTSITSGTAYWLAILSTTGQLNTLDQYPSGSMPLVYQSGKSSFPNPAGTVATQASSAPASLYITT